MTVLPNRRDDEVRRFLDTPHPAVPGDLPARAIARGRRILHRRRIARWVLWTALVTATVTGLVVAILMWPDSAPATPSVSGRDSWWAPGT